MKNNKTKVLLLAAFTALTVVAVTGCKDKKSSESSVSEEVLIQPLTFSYGSDDYDEEATSADGLEGQDPTAAPGTDETVEYEEVTEYVPVTEANGEPVTTYVTVTDAAGEPATEDGGETQTTAITVTTEIKVTKPVNQTETTTSTGNEYVPYNDSAYAMWIDISKDEDYVFNDEFIEVVFKIKDNAPDGAYDVKISNPDFASLKDNVKTVKPGKLVNGKVYVNQEAEAQEDISGSDTFVVYTESASGKQGEEVIVRFGMKNNPGLCAINFWFDYDRNAMEIVECSAVGEFGDIANSTSFGNPQG